MMSIASRWLLAAILLPPSILAQKSVLPTAGHGFMVRRDSNVAEPRGMDGMTVCLSPGTTNELVTADFFRANNLRFTPILQERMQDNAAALQAGRCDAIGTDATQLAAIRSQFAKPDDFVILPQRFSKEPYGPVVRRDDWPQASARASTGRARAAR